ncbi:MAG: outer membrane protein transport protein, partial [Candidatus Zixiibacteriota bacterium]
MSSRFASLGAAALLVVLASPALATNGMNLEGYGPIASGMGGASFAFDNGSAAVMNNPATLSLMPAGFRLDLAVGMLGPDVTAQLGGIPGSGPVANSSADAFFMPALGLVRKEGKMAYGLGVFGQGGMGTEYGKDTWMSDPSGGANSALTEGLVNRSEVSVGRAMGTFAYEASAQFHIGATVDLVWAGMDLQMAMSEPQFQDLANPQAQTIGSASGTLVNAFGQMYEPFGGTGILRLYHAYFDFSNDNDFTGEAMGYGVAGKIGAVYEATPDLTFGAVYQSQTAMGDLESDNAALSMAVFMDPGILQGQPTQDYQDVNIPLSGAITIKDFEWPSIFGAGFAYQPRHNLMLAADVKQIMWSQVMEDFKMNFVVDDVPENGGFAGLELDATLFQNWEDQTVIAAGGAYKPTSPLTLRAGFNYGKNPVPEKYLNALFPAIVESHGTFGAGYDFGQGSQLNVSVQVAFEKEATSPGVPSAVEPTTDFVIPPVTSSHSQLSWMIMYTHS